MLKIGYINHKAKQKKSLMCSETSTVFIVHVFQWKSLWQSKLIVLAAAPDKRYSEDHIKPQNDQLWMLFCIRSKLTWSKHK